jgi:hypothetical protein
LQPASNTSDLAGLLAQTRAALAHLRADELEALALRAEQMLESTASATAASDSTLFLTSPIHRERRLLADLLAATDQNLRILRRLHGGPAAEGNSRWAR